MCVSGARGTPRTSPGSSRASAQRPRPRRRCVVPSGSDGHDVEGASAFRRVAVAGSAHQRGGRSEEHTSELQSLRHLVCRLLLEKKKQTPKLIFLLQKKQNHKNKD